MNRKQSDCSNSKHSFAQFPDHGLLSIRYDEELASQDALESRADSRSRTGQAGTSRAVKDGKTKQATWK